MLIAGCNRTPGRVSAPAAAVREPTRGGLRARAERAAGGLRGPRGPEAPGRLGAPRRDGSERRRRVGASEQGSLLPPFVAKRLKFPICNI